MAIDVEAFKAHLNMTADEGDEIDEAVLQRFLDAARAHCERILGYKFDDTIQLPDGAPADLEQAVLMLGAHWFSEREAVIIGVNGQEVPFGVAQILGEHRSYSFG